MTLREQKGWAYGASSGIGSGRGSQVFSAGASVQADKSAEAMAEAARILRDIAGSHPVNAAELATARNDMSLGLRSEEHTSELQSLMRISYAVFCLNKKNSATRRPSLPPKKKKK